MTIVIKVAIFFLNCIYRLFWVCPVKDKIVFISREADKPSVDIRYLMTEFQEKYPNYQVEALCKTIDNGIKGKLFYGLHMISQMYHMATAKVVALDTYCIAASVLKHRKELTIVQMWHAVGCLKKFSYSILDKAEGRSSKIAKLMRMHQNYDYIFVSSEQCKPYLAEAYQCPEDIMEVIPLPRMDILTKEEEKRRCAIEIYAKYPQLQDKKTILYVPTFRKNGNQDEAIVELIENIDLQKYNFVLKYHPIVSEGADMAGVITDNMFSSLEWMSVSDYVITDYSAVSYEAAVAEKPLFFYIYDWKDYEKDRSFYIDYMAEMPGIITEKASEIAHAIEEENYDLQRVKDFANKYIAEETDYTAKAVEFLARLF